MHELGVVFHVIKSVEDIAKENNVTEVTAVTLELGEVSTVIPYYLEDCWKWAVKKHEVMKNAELKIETIPAVTYCEDCGKEYGTVEHGKTCPHCGSDKTYLVRGNEFLIKEIEVGDPDPNADTAGNAPAAQEESSWDPAGMDISDSGDLDKRD